MLGIVNSRVVAFEYLFFYKYGYITRRFQPLSAVVEAVADSDIFANKAEEDLGETVGSVKFRRTTAEFSDYFEKVLTVVYSFIPLTSVKITFLWRIKTCPRRKMVKKARNAKLLLKHIKIL